MRLISFQQSAEPRMGLLQGNTVLDIGVLLGPATPRSMPELIASEQVRDQLLGISAGRGDFNHAQLHREEITLLPPIPRPGKIICLAGNYREHITESGFAAPALTAVITPQLFLKPSTALIADRAEILLNHNNVKVGWEAELAVIIGKPGRHIPAGSAMEHVFGYTVLNDLSERRLNARIENRHKREFDPFFDWLAGKWFDGFAPCGPAIVTADEVSDPHNLAIRLWVNGELRQQGNTGDMIFRIPETIAYVSSIMTLEPGDIISTGTPAGAGLGEGDSSLKDGDELVCEVEQVGRLQNQVRCNG